MPISELGTFKYVYLTESSCKPCADALHKKRNDKETKS